MSKIEVRYAESLSQVYVQIEEISEKIRRQDDYKNKERRPLLWFRGVSNTNHNLEPNIFRGAEYKYNDKQTYSNNHLREDYRFQNFMSRNFDNVTERLPQSVIEWQEIMQHYFSKTRLMDWSESLTVSLAFALNAFIMPEQNEETKIKQSLTPALWILRPDALNMQVYRSFYKENSSLIYNVLDNIPKKGRLAKKIRKEMEEKEGIYVDLKQENEQNMNVLVSLSALEHMRSSYRGRETEALINFEINPFFYMLLRYYSDGIPVELGKLPPLAIIHPYHSQRIKMQRGVFTVFPYYIPDSEMEDLKNLLGKYPPIAMEYMEQCIPYLYKIQITDPQRVADELMITGSRYGGLYPDMENISKDMENVV